MRIAQVAPLIESVPPKHYGGTERIVSYLTEELVRFGHEVTLFGSGDSVTSARLVAPTRRSLRLHNSFAKSSEQRAANLAVAVNSAAAVSKADDKPGAPAACNIRARAARLRALQRLSVFLARGRGTCSFFGDLHRRRIRKR
jgi:hypothetical protein